MCNVRIPRLVDRGKSIFVVLLSTQFRYIFSGRGYLDQFDERGMGGAFEGDVDVHGCAILAHKDLGNFRRVRRLRHVRLRDSFAPETRATAQSGDSQLS